VPRPSLIAPGPRAKALVAVALLACVCLPGCVRRRLTVRSNPPGALVYIDDQPIGYTPVSTPYVYYGTRKIQLIKDGYKTETVMQRFPPPWYEVPPLDFASENLWPGELRDQRVLDFQLVPQPIVPREQLLSQAENLRAMSRSGLVNPLPGSGVPVAPPAQPLPLTPPPPGPQNFQSPGVLPPPPNTAPPGFAPQPTPQPQQNFLPSGASPNAPGAALWQQPR
jgi:hypothetical protein